MPAITRKHVNPLKIAKIVTQFVSDITDSVSRDRDGYLAKLESDYKNLRTNFDTAIKEIYS